MPRPVRDVSRTLKELRVGKINPHSDHCGVAHDRSWFATQTPNYCYYYVLFVSHILSSPLRRRNVERKSFPAPL